MLSYPQNFLLCKIRGKIIKCLFLVLRDVIVSVLEINYNESNLVEINMNLLQLSNLVPDKVTSVRLLNNAVFYMIHVCVPMAMQ